MSSSTPRGAGSARTSRLRTAWEGHLLLLYAAEPERAAALVAWAKDGLVQGDKLVCVEPAEQLGSLVRLLERGGVPTADALASGRLEILAPVAASARLSTRDGLRREVAVALTTGFAGLRVSVDVPALRRSLPTRAVVAVERALDEGAGGAPLAALCQYERTVDGDGVAVVHAHPDGFRTAMLAGRRTPDGLALAGEIDVSNVDLVVAALGRLADAAGPLLCLDLADLRFMDVAGCRALARATRVYRNAGGVLLLADPLPPVAYVLTLLGVDRLGGVETVAR